MVNKSLNTQVLNICKTTDEWNNETSIISKGLLCIEFTTDGKTLAKIGDGINPYSTLAYVTDPYIGDIENALSKIVDVSG